MERKKVLLIKLSSLGDVIFNIPLSYALKEAGYEVSWLVSEKGYQVVNNNPCVDKTILAPIFKWRKNKFSFKNIVEFWAIIKKLREEKYDIAIDSQMMFKSLFFNMFCGAKRRITSIMAKECSILGANELVKGISYFPKCPIVLNYLKFAEYLGIKTEQIKTSLPERSKEQVFKINELLKNIDLSKPLVVIAPATTWENKEWNPENWKYTVDKLSEHVNIVFSGGEKDKDLIESINNKRFLNLAGQTDLMELIELFSRADIVISPDSGSAHLAWALNKPAVITIFTCSPENVLAPIGNDEKYFALHGENLSCRPCFKKKCKLKTNKNICTTMPEPEKVLEIVNKILN